jgi:putative ABC transport system permease protein
MGIGLVSEQVQSKLRDNAKELLTSDLVVSARRDLSDVEKKQLAEIVKDIPKEEYRVIDIYSMVQHVESRETRLVEIRGVEKTFPFYGKMTADSGNYDQEKLFISKDLADLWQISAGHHFKIGAVTEIVSGIMVNDSSQGLRGFSLAPRIYLPLSKLFESQLLKPGATGSYAYHFRFLKLQDSEVKQLKEKITNALTDVGIRVTLPEESSEQTGRTLGYLTDFMALAALIGLILSLVGIFYLYQSHLVARLKDICLLHLHGLNKRKLF